MNIILLSGGSGKRLWPLSNDTHSKQFLKLLKAPDGKYESMVQRVYRQLRESGIEDRIVIATSKSQQDSIYSQLGDAVEIVIEPERRDTFPAIALSCAYLLMEKGCSRDEVAVVLPVDPYTEDGYFQTLHKMEKAVRENAADLVLMGIKPEGPSEKYGYIIPEDNSDDPVIYVKSFSEKPTPEKARKLIEEGAYWNGGVFAFRLGYLEDITGKYMDPSSFEEMRERYSEFRKTSFDYEIVENASSVAMIRYEGEWKDLGTWNELTDKMSDSSKGKVIIGEGTENTHIINDLNIPIVALGVKNLVIAASPDGILVTDKDASAQLKPYVDRIDQRPMYEERRWGAYEVLDYTTCGDRTKTMTKHLFIKEGKNISYQTHMHRDEIWVIVEGIGELLLDGHTRNVRRGDMAYIQKGQKHAMKAITDLNFIEIQTGTDLIEDDIERFEWNWNGEAESIK